MKPQNARDRGKSLKVSRTFSQEQGTHGNGDSGWHQT